MKFKTHFAGVIALATALCFSALRAEPVNPELARKAALRQVEIMNHRAENAGCLHLTCTIASAAKPIYDENGREALAYVFDLSPQGFVVISADNDLVPVIAYSEHGSFPWDEDPENILLHMLREDLGLRLDVVELTDAEIIEANHNQWEGLLSGDRLYLDPGESWPEVGATWTGGWVESAWHQRSPYNDLCPIDPETDECCIVGCVATAMAQIVNYWQYPSSIAFTERDNYVTDSLEIKIYAPNASIPSLDYNDGNPSDEMCAGLSYACGVGAKMDYSSESSNAYYSNCRNSLLTHFSFINAEFILLHSTLKCNTKVSDFEGCFEAQALPGSVIKP